MSELFWLLVLSQVSWITSRRLLPTLPATIWVRQCSACWFGWWSLKLRSACLRRLHCRGSQTGSTLWWKWPRRPQRYVAAKSLLWLSHHIVKGLMLLLKACKDRFLCKENERLCHHSHCFWSPITNFIVLFLPGLRNLRPCPPVHDPDANQRQCPIVLVHHVTGENQSLPLHGSLLCSLSAAGPWV